MGFGPQYTKRWLLTSAVLGATILVVIWVTALNSDPYAKALNVTHQAPEVVQAFGAVKDISLRGFTMTLDDAEFRLAVEGARGNGTVIVALRKDPSWRLEQLRVQP